MTKIIPRELIKHLEWSPDNNRPDMDMKDNPISSELDESHVAPPKFKQRAIQIVLYISLLLGTAMIISGILKTWLSKPNSFDWFLAALGVLLCGMAIFSKFSLTKEGLNIEIRDTLNNLMKYISLQSTR